MSDALTREQDAELKAEIVKLREFYAATIPLLDWLSNKDLSADHEAQCPAEYHRINAALEALDVGGRND